MHLASPSSSHSHKVLKRRKLGEVKQARRSETSSASKSAPLKKTHLWRPPGWIQSNPSQIQVQISLWTNNRTDNRLQIFPNNEMTWYIDITHRPGLVCCGRGRSDVNVSFSLNITIYCSTLIICFKALLSIHYLTEVARRRPSVA